MTRQQSKAPQECETAKRTRSPTAGPETSPGRAIVMCWSLRRVTDAPGVSPPLAVGRAPGDRPRHAVVVRRVALAGADDREPGLRTRQHDAPQLERVA